MTTRVSNSEALALTCEAKWMYSFHPDYKLEPKSQSIALTRGTIGHKALEMFFRAMMTGANREEAEKDSLVFLASEITQGVVTGDFVRQEAATKVSPVIQAYFKSKNLQKFLDDVTILEVEKRFEVELPDDFIAVGQIDLIVKYTKGQYKGEIVPVDNKFVYNFWTEDDFRMNSQIPTYIFAVRELYPEGVIKRGMINQLRHRANAVSPFELTPITPERGEIDNIIANHIKQSMRIKELRELSGPVIRQSVTRSLSKYTCENCGFKLLCKSELTNGNTQGVIKLNYQPNSYGYNGNDSE